MRSGAILLKPARCAVSWDGTDSSQNNTFGMSVGAGLNRMNAPLKRDRTKMYPVHASAKRDSTGLNQIRTSLNRVRKIRKADAEQRKACLLDVSPLISTGLEPGEGEDDLPFEPFQRLRGREQSC